MQEEKIFNDHLEFASIVLQYTAVDEWSTVNPGNVTHVDDKFTSGIIDAFWKGHRKYQTWLADGDGMSLRGKAEGK